LLAFACSGEPALPTSDVVSALPWQGDEQLRYVIKAGDGRVVAEGILLIDVIGSRTNLAQSFGSPDDSKRDDVTVQVDSATLKPIGSNRRIVSGDQSSTLEVTYTEQGALIKAGDRQTGLSVPEHSYDNDTSLFVWRTIPFAEGYRAAYTTIITNHRTRQQVTLHVTGKEMVSVPAGEFNAWRLEVEAGGVRQIAWYADTPARPLVKYDNDNGQIFELVALP
jgi:hypothetical protein